MTDNKTTRLSKLARELNVGINTIVEFLQKKGIEVDTNPNAKISSDVHDLLVKEFSTDISVKKESEKLQSSFKHLRDKKEAITIGDGHKPHAGTESEEDELIIKDFRVGAKPQHEEVFQLEKPKLSQDKIKVLGKIDIDTHNKPKPKEEEPAEVKAPQPEPPEPPKTPEPVVVPVPQAAETPIEKVQSKDVDVRVVGKIDLDSMNLRTRPEKKGKPEPKPKPEQEPKKTVVLPVKEEPVQPTIVPEQVEETLPPAEVAPAVPEAKVEDNFITTKFQKLSGPTIVGKIDLPREEEKKKSPAQDADGKRNKRKRIKKDIEKVDVSANRPQVKNEDLGLRKKDKKFEKKGTKPTFQKNEVSAEDVQKQIKDTLARLTSKGKSKGSKYRREKRDAFREREQEAHDLEELERNILKVTEFVSVSELASLMNVPVVDIIRTCMNLGLMVSINQRLDAETMSVVAEEFNYKVEFVSPDLTDVIEEETDSDEELQPRPPIVTVMGHVDHGKTKLLDYIRSANVIAGEAGGITQHIGAYGVVLESGRQITFLDTPGHEAFTAMRARGAQVTDVAIIVVAADDGVMPQTVEAINHASAAGVPIVFAINKVDKPTANPEKIKEELANMNYLVEDWGGKYQSQEISAKSGLNIDALLEKVLLESELLDVKANPYRRASGTVIESSLDKGRGFTATILVQNGTLRVGDVMLAGSHSGRVKAMFNERGKKLDEAGPSTPVVILGLDGAPQAGDKFNCLDSEKEAKDIANKREQLQREQAMRTKKHITLDEIGRRIAIGNFKELNIIVKGDVDGSVEALSDSLLKLSTEEIVVNVIHKAVGQISEGDILLAAASNAIIVGFQVRPSLNARRLAEREQIDIRLYSIIYDAIEEIKAAMEGMLSPEIKEEINATLEIREIFKITKVGTIAGCIVREGKINRSSKVRVIRDGIVVYTGVLGSLKRFKDDVKEVVSGQDCGLNIENYNDIKVGDLVEAFSQTEVAKKL